ncbi:MAG: winged helix-turn-helix domain-containing protein [Euryarchaeota archaeon]|nr:winged helix-turn-helix domain-containing protein [Euryarchaeota archaeon]
MHPDDISHPDDGSDEKVLILPLGEESKKITQTLSNDSARQVLELLTDKPMSASDIAEQLDIPLTTVKYNLDALIESGLITIKQTRWSVKGREIKIYAPIRKLIVVVPNKADKKSVVDILKGYLGVLLGAAGISAIIEWWHKPLFVGTQYALKDVTEETTERGIPAPTPVEMPPPMEGALPAPVCAPTPVNVTEAGVGGGATDVLLRVQEVAVEEAVATCTPTSAPVPDVMLPVPEPTLMAPPAMKGGGMDMPSIDLTQMLGGHPGVWFLFGCIFVVVLLVLMEYRRRGV